MKDGGPVRGMIRQAVGLVKAVHPRGEGLDELQVVVGGAEAAALNYGALTGPVYPGDLVLLNTTAVHLGLGTGGVHFVGHNFSRPLPDFGGPGHIMKLRYTPWQLRVLACEEEAAGYRALLEDCRGLNGMPVLIGELHSMVAPAAAVLKYYRPSCRIAYVMTDGGALPLPFSRVISELKRKGIIAATVTCGHAFGGDYEAVNVYSALLASRAVLRADLALISMGPGNAGTGTRFGFSGMEVGEHVNRVNALGGKPVVIPRLGFADPRPRHRGVSHHTLTALAAAAFSPACLPLPALPPRRLRLLIGQLRRRGLLRRHRLQVLPAPPVEAIMLQLELSSPASMGRSYADDPVFFDAAGAAALAALRLLGKASRTKEEKDDGETGGGDAVFELSLPRPDHQRAPGPRAPARRQDSLSRGGGAPRSGGGPGPG